jgi:hypothetical protein
MENIIIATTLATTLATTAIFTLGANSANAMDFNTEMQMKEVVGQYAKFLYLAHACDIEDKYVLTDAVFEAVYNAFGQDIYDYNKIDAEFNMPKYNYDFMTQIDYVKNNIDNPAVENICNNTKENAAKVLDKLKEEE